jgi:hypothetical protein
MKATTRSAVLLIPALALIALTGCVPGIGGVGVDDVSDSDGTDGTGASDSAGGAIGDCASGHVWSVDVDDMADQLFAFMTSSGGLAVQSVTAEGTQFLTWNADNSVSMDTAYEFTVIANLDDGLVMTMVQSHTGTSTGSLTLDGSTATPTNWDNSGYVINTTVDISGASVEMDFDLPATGIEDGANVQITCEGDALTTVADGGGFHQNWTRTD